MSFAGDSGYTAWSPEIDCLPRTISLQSCGRSALGDGIDGTVELFSVIEDALEGGVSVVANSSDDDPWRECDGVVGADDDCLSIEGSI